MAVEVENSSSRIVGEMPPEREAIGIGSVLRSSASHIVITKPLSRSKLSETLTGRPRERAIIAVELIILGRIWICW
jgi:hypothetical protein